MKKYIKKNQKIYGMAVNRKKAIDDLYSLSDALAEHIIKCIVYGNTVGCLHHWVKEVCELLAHTNRITLKPNGKRLKRSDYIDTIFASMGEDLIDAELAVERFMILNRHDRNAYPDFVVDSQLSEQVFNAFNKIKDYMLPILVTNNDMTANDFYPTIWGILGN